MDIDKRAQEIIGEDTVEKSEAALLLSGVDLTPTLLSDIVVENTTIDWQWHGFLAKSHTTLLSALWKSGKTTFILQALAAMQNETFLAGQQTKKSKVLIVSEESKSLWARRRDEHGIDLPVWLVCRPIRHRLSYKEWGQFISQMAQFCKENEIDVFIIDTLSTFWPVDNENDASRVESALLPLNHFLENNIAVLLVHHFRKSGGEEGTASRGSGALGAHVDIMIDFTRMGSDDPTGTKRVLKCYSRFEETPIEIVIDYVNGEYQTIGTRSEVAMNSKLSNIFEVMKTQTGGLAASEIGEIWDDDNYGKRPSDRTIRRYLRRLAERGDVEVVGEKMVGKTKAPVYKITQRMLDTLYRKGSVLTSDIEPKNGGQNNAGQNNLSGVISEDNQRKDKMASVDKTNLKTLDRSQPSLYTESGVVDDNSDLRENMGAKAKSLDTEKLQTAYEGLLGKHQRAKGKKEQNLKVALEAINEELARRSDKKPFNKEEAIETLEGGV